MNNVQSISVKDALSLGIETLKRVKVPVDLIEEIGVPLNQVVKLNTQVLLTILKEEQWQKEKAAKLKEEAAEPVAEEVVPEDMEGVEEDVRDESDDPTNTPAET